jgi:hypothetical protein
MDAPAPGSRIMGAIALPLAGIRQAVRFIVWDNGIGFDPDWGPAVTAAE